MAKWKSNDFENDTRVQLDRLVDGLLDGLVPALRIVPHRQEDFGVRKSFHQLPEAKQRQMD